MTESAPLADVIFRDAVASDAAALSVIGAQSFIDTFGHLYQPADLALFLTKHDVAHWAADLADPTLSIRIGEAGSAAAAYAKVSPVDLPVERDASRHALELKQFYVLGPWHGSGVAATLMDWVLAEARERGAHDLYLSVFTQNNRARRFYERYGFEVIGQWAFMVGDHPDEDYLMRLRLDD